MNQALIDGIEQGIWEAKARRDIADADIGALSAELEVAKKMGFKPFTVKITVNTIAEARTLGTIAGANASVSRFLAEQDSGIFADTNHLEANSAIAKLLQPFFNKFRWTGSEWEYQA